MGEKKRGFIFYWSDNWRFKDFALGMHISSQAWNDLREYYLLISLGFWQLSIGFRL
jgi:hypothetical protein